MYEKAEEKTCKMHEMTTNRVRETDRVAIKSWRDNLPVKHIRRMFD